MEFDASLSGALSIQSIHPMLATLSAGKGRVTIALSESFEMKVNASPAEAGKAQDLLNGVEVLRTLAGSIPKAVDLGMTEILDALQLRLSSDSRHISASLGLDTEQALRLFALLAFLTG